MDEARIDPLTADAPSSGYTARELPPEEWTRLPTEMQAALRPELSVVVVVEDAAGEIVGRWAAMNVVHLEGLYIDEAHRGNPIVAGGLAATTIQTLRAHGVASAVTLIQADEVRALAAHFGFTLVPGTLHRLDL